MSNNLQAWKRKTSWVLPNLSSDLLKNKYFSFKLLKGIKSENETVRQKINSLFIYFSGSVPSGAEERQVGWAAFSRLQRVRRGWEYKQGEETLPWAGQIPAPESAKRLSVLQLLPPCIRHLHLGCRVKVSPFSSAQSRAKINMMLLCSREGPFFLFKSSPKIQISLQLKASTTRAWMLNSLLPVQSVHCLANDYSP